LPRPITSSQSLEEIKRLIGENNKRTKKETARFPSSGTYKSVDSKGNLDKLAGNLSEQGEGNMLAPNEHLRYTAFKGRRAKAPSPSAQEATSEGLLKPKDLSTLFEDIPRALRYPQLSESPLYQSISPRSGKAGQAVFRLFCAEEQAVQKRLWNEEK
jgi:hypothetical protein